MVGPKNALGRWQGSLLHASPREASKVGLNRGETRRATTHAKRSTVGAGSDVSMEIVGCAGGVNRQCHTMGTRLRRPKGQESGAAERCAMAQNPQVMPAGLPWYERQVSMLSGASAEVPRWGRPLSSSAVAGWILLGFVCGWCGSVQHRSSHQAVAKLDHPADGRPPSWRRQPPMIACGAQQAHRDLFDGRCLRL